MRAKYLFYFLIAVPFLAPGCAEDVVEHDAAPEMPVASFPNMNKDIAVVVDSPVRFEAVIESDGPVECSWSISGEKVASTPAMTYVFSEVGEYSVVFEAFNSVGKITEEFTVRTTGVPLDVGFSITDETVNVSVGEDLAITAQVISGDKEVKHLWKVNDETASETETLTYKFQSSGIYTISYTGINSDDMTFTRTWTVNVADLPLQIEFSLKESEVTLSEGSVLTIVTDVISGGEGMVHSWSVDGSKISDAPVFSHTFDEAGSYTVAYSGVNSKEETVEKSWNVTVIAGTDAFMYNDFETLDAVPSNITGNTSALFITANPKVSSVNSSSKVLMDKLPSDYSTSGYINVNSVDFPDKGEYGAIRVKIYLGKAPYYPRLMLTVNGVELRKLPSAINGESFVGGDESKWKELIETEDWNVFVYDLKDCGFGIEDFSTITDIQFRPLCKFDGSNIDKAPADDINTRTAYYDDIEFLRK